MKLALPIYQETDRYFPIRFNHIDFLSNFAVPVLCRSKMIRDELIQRCDGKIEIRPIVSGDMLIQPFFKKYVPQATLINSNSRIIHDQGLYFGNNPELTEEEISQIIHVFTQK